MRDASLSKAVVPLVEVEEEASEEDGCSHAESQALGDMDTKTVRTSADVATPRLQASPSSDLNPQNLPDTVTRASRSISPASAADSGAARWAAHAAQLNSTRSIA